MIIDFIIEDLMLNSYLQKNFHTLLYLCDNIVQIIVQLFLQTLVLFRIIPKLHIAD